MEYLGFASQEMLPSGGLWIGKSRDLLWPSAKWFFSASEIPNSGSENQSPYLKCVCVIYTVVVFTLATQETL